MDIQKFKRLKRWFYFSVLAFEALLFFILKPILTGGEILLILAFDFVLWLVLYIPWHELLFPGTVTKLKRKDFKEGLKLYLTSLLIGFFISLINTSIYKKNFQLTYFFDPAVYIYAFYLSLWVLILILVISFVSGAIRKTFE